MSMKQGLSKMVGLTAAVAIAAAMLTGAAEPAKSAAKVGQPAPAFTLKDAAGKEHKLADFEGRIVVLEWTNPDCPYIVRVYRDGVIKRTVEEMKKIDDKAVYLAINSTHNVVPEDNVAFLKKHGMDRLTVLFDQDGTVGRLFDARNTPHMFVIDGKGVLRYQGAIDDDRQGRKAEKGESVTNYVINAVRQIKSGETVAPDQTTPYGCTVKYKS
jgi:peroxiredoxin